MEESRTRSYALLLFEYSTLSYLGTYKSLLPTSSPEIICFETGVTMESFGEDDVACLCEALCSLED